MTSKPEQPNAAPQVPSTAREKTQEQSVPAVVAPLTPPTPQKGRRTDAKNAARYRWLAYNMRVLRVSADGARHYVDVPPAKSFDEAIDAAMSYPGAKGEGREG